jgi:hypothetical protein
VTQFRTDSSGAVDPSARSVLRLSVPVAPWISGKYAGHLANREGDARLQRCVPEFPAIRILWDFPLLLDISELSTTRLVAALADL